MKVPSKANQLLLISYGAFIALAIPAGALGVAWLYIQDTFGLTLSSLGVVLAVSSIGQLTISIFSGSMMTRIGVGRFLLLGHALRIAGMLGGALAPAWWLFVATGVVNGAGSAMIINGLNAFVAANYRSSRMNWLHASFGLGSTFGPALVTFIVIYQGLSWRWSYLVMVGLQSIVALFLLATVRDWHIVHSTHEIGPAPELSKVRMRDTLSLPAVWFSIALFFFATGSEINTGQLTNSLFVEGRGIDPRVAGQWISLYWAAFTGGRLLAGLIVDRVDHDRFLRVTMLGSMVGAALVWANFTEMWSFAGLALIGFTLGPTAPTLFSDTPRRVGLDHVANAIGFQNAGAGLGIALPPWLAGVLAVQLGMEIIGPFLFVFTLITFVLHEFMVLRERRPAVVAGASIDGV